MRALLGRIILSLNELHHWSVKGGYFQRLASVLILGGVLSVPIIILASPALVLFTMAGGSSHSEELYLAGEVWLFCIIGLIAALIVFLIVRKVSETISLRRYSKVRQQKRRFRRN